MKSKFSVHFLADYCEKNKNNGKSVLWKRKTSREVAMAEGSVEETSGEEEGGGDEERGQEEGGGEEENRVQAELELGKAWGHAVLPKTVYGNNPASTMRGTQTRKL